MVEILWTSLSDERQRAALKHQLSNQPHHEADDSDFDDLSDPGKTGFDAAPKKEN